MVPEHLAILDRLHAVALRADNDELEHLEVLLDALDIYRERAELRGDLWRELGIHDSTAQVKTKAMRIVTMMSSGLLEKPELYDEALDEPRDLINYAVFWSRLLAGHRAHALHQQMLADIDAADDDD